MHKWNNIKIDWKKLVINTLAEFKRCKINPVMGVCNLILSFKRQKSFFQLELKYLTFLVKLSLFTRQHFCNLPHLLQCCGVQGQTRISPLSLINSVHHYLVSSMKKSKIVPIDDQLHPTISTCTKITWKRNYHLVFLALRISAVNI